MQVAGLRQVCTYLLRARAANARGMTRLISISVLLLNSASCVAGVWAAPRPHLSVAGQSSQRARHGSLLRRGVGADGRGGAGAAASPRLQPGKRISFKPNAFFNGKRITMHRCRRSRCGGGGAAVASSRLQPGMRDTNSAANAFEHVCMVHPARPGGGRHSICWPQLPCSLLQVSKPAGDGHIGARQMGRTCRRQRRGGSHVQVWMCSAST